MTLAPINPSGEGTKGPRARGGLSVPRGSRAVCAPIATQPGRRGFGFLGTLDGVSPPSHSLGLHARARSARSCADVFSLMGVYPAMGKWVTPGDVSTCAGPHAIASAGFSRQAPASLQAGSQLRTAWRIQRSRGLCGVCPACFKGLWLLVNSCCRPCSASYLHPALLGLTPYASVLYQHNFANTITTHSRPAGTCRRSLALTVRGRREEECL